MAVVLPQVAAPVGAVVENLEMRGASKDEKPKAWLKQDRGLY